MHVHSSEGVRHGVQALMPSAKRLLALLGFGPGKGAALEAAWALQPGTSSSLGVADPQPAFSSFPSGSKEATGSPHPLLPSHISLSALVTPVPTAPCPAL